jgi:pilus assembly protein CpaE
MLQETLHAEINRLPVWPWRVGLVLETPALLSEISAALQEMNAVCVFSVPAGTPPFEVARMVQREKPEILFVELANIAGRPADWIGAIRSGEEIPLVAAVHATPEPDEMISALRAGASEFLCLPVRPSVFDAMDRISTTLESRRSSTVEQGRMAGILSAKGGCGATTVACHLSVALQGACAPRKVLLADLDYQSASAHRVFRAASRNRLGDAFDSVRRLNSACWPEFVTAVTPGIDLLGGFGESAAGAPFPEPWRIDNLFRFVTRHYSWILADLGRHVNPVNWAFLQSIDELFIVTAPDVLALYQTRSLLQTLTKRGFDKSRLRLILNRNQSSRQDFWVESIEKMFEISIISVIPNDNPVMGALARDRFEFPANSGYGRAVTKLAQRMAKPIGPEIPKRAA